MTLPQNSLALNQAGKKIVCLLKKNAWVHVSDFLKRYNLEKDNYRILSAKNKNWSEQIFKDIPIIHVKALKHQYPTGNERPSGARRTAVASLLPTPLRTAKKVLIFSKIAITIANSTSGRVSTALGQHLCGGVQPNPPEHSVFQK